MSKKKVLFITPSLCQGGREHSLIMMLKLLDKTKYDLTLFVYLDDMTLLPLVPKEVKVVQDKQKPHYYRKPKAIFYSVLKMISSKLGIKKYSKSVSDKLKEYIHRQKVIHPSKDIFNKEHFDQVVVNAEGFTAEVGVFINASKKTMIYHNSIDMNHSLLERLIPRYDKIVAVSNGVKKMLTTNYQNLGEKITVIENYVDANQIIEKAKAKLDNLPKCDVLLCTCGRLSKEKGFDLAVEAAHILKQNGLDFKWYFVSDGAQREQIEQLIEEYSLQDNIIITGYVENPFPYYKACDIYVQPSYHESFGLTMKEAIILGKTVVSTYTVGASTVLEDGKYGKVVAVDSKAIADGIIQLLVKTENYERYDINKNSEEKLIYINKIEHMLDT